MRRSKLKLKLIVVTAGGRTYKSFRASGTVNGRRIRLQSTDRNEAYGVLNRLQIEAANCVIVHSRPTRMSAEQVSEVERLRFDASGPARAFPPPWSGI